MELWEDDSAWSLLSTAKNQRYMEIQGGPIGDQSIKLEMQPKQIRWHVEYWFPADKKLNIYGLKVPVVNLRPTADDPIIYLGQKSRGQGLGGADEYS